MLIFYRASLLIYTFIHLFFVFPSYVKKKVLLGVWQYTKKVGGSCIQLCHLKRKERKGKQSNPIKEFVIPLTFHFLHLRKFKKGQIIKEKLLSNFLHSSSQVNE